MGGFVDMFCDCGRAGGEVGAMTAFYCLMRAVCEM